MIAGMWSFQTESERFIKAYNNYLSKAPAKIFVFPQIPELSLSANKSQRFKEMGLESRVEVKLDYRVANETLKRLTEKYRSSTYLELETDNFFDSAPYYRGVLIYTDTHHLNQIGAVSYAELIKREMRERVLTVVDQK